tara:strand:+ start:1202 stop:1744 length:543 start_codon:yes stop_codon:yes gene_type:complete
MAITNNYLGFDPLINAQQVVTYSFTNQNTDLTLISNNLIQMAEFAHLKSAIGKDFYLHLKKVFNTPPTGTPTTAETNFMSEWLIPTFAWFVRFEVINEIQDNSTSAGIVTNMPEFSKAVDAKTLNVYKQDTYRRGNVMLQAMIEFLDDNANEFPQYNATTSVDCGNTKNGVSKQHGMIIY